MKSLQHLTQDLIQVNESLELTQGELDEKLELELKQLETDLTVKSDNYGYRIDKLELMAEFWANKAAEASAIKKQIEKHSDNMRERIKSTMISLDKKEIKGEEYKFVIRTSNQPKLIIDGPVPPEYLMEVSDMVDDKERIKADLMAGKEVAGARLEHGMTLNIRANKD